MKDIVVMVGDVWQHRKTNKEIVIIEVVSKHGHFEDDDAHVIVRHSSNTHGHANNSSGDVKSLQAPRETWDGFQGSLSSKDLFKHWKKQ